MHRFLFFKDWAFLLWWCLFSFLELWLYGHLDLVGTDHRDLVQLRFDGGMDGDDFTVFLVVISELLFVGLWTFVIAHHVLTHLALLISDAHLLLDVRQVPCTLSDCTPPGDTTNSSRGIDSSEAASNWICTGYSRRIILIRSWKQSRSELETPYRTERRLSLIQLIQGSLWQDIVVILW